MLCYTTPSRGWLWARCSRQEGFPEIARHVPGRQTASLGDLVKHRERLRSPGRSASGMGCASLGCFGEHRQTVIDNRPSLLS
jgi:hypothetical protein